MMVGSIIGYTIAYLFVCLPAILSTYGIMRLSYYFKTNKSSESESNLLETLKSRDKKIEELTSYRDKLAERCKMLSNTNDSLNEKIEELILSLKDARKDIDASKQSISDKADVTISDSYNKNCSDCMYSVRHTLDIDIPYLQLLESSKSLLSMVNIYKVVILAYQDKLKKLGEI